MLVKKFYPTTRAVVTGKIATVLNGVRIVKQYYSGDKLTGKLEN